MHERTHRHARGARHRLDLASTARRERLQAKESDESNQRESARTAHYLAVLFDGASSRGSVGMLAGVKKRCTSTLEAKLEGLPGFFIESLTAAKMAPDGRRIIS